jgi:hypothetical protein
VIAGILKVAHETQFFQETLSECHWARAQWGLKIKELHVRQEYKVRLKLNGLTFGGRKTDRCDSGSLL